MKRFVITIVAWSVAAGMCAGTAFADDNTPKSTGSMTLPLVRVYPGCGESTTAARCVPGTSAGWPACPAGTPATTLILGPKGKGTITIKVVKPSTKSPTGDIKFSASITDVRDNSDRSCGAAPCPYNGVLNYYDVVNNTDDNLCGSLSGSTCTLTDVCAAGSEPAGTACSADTDCGTGGVCTNTCTVSTFPQTGTISCTNGKCTGAGSANALIPEVHGGHHQNIELGVIQIQDASGNPFLAPGLVVP